MKNEKDEWRMMKVEDFKLLRGFDDRWTNRHFVNVESLLPLKIAPLTCQRLSLTLEKLYLVWCRTRNLLFITRWVLLWYSYSFMFRLGLLQSYEKHRTRLMINLSRFGLFVPKLVDLRWKLELIEQDNLLCKRGELIYTIEMDILRNKYCTGKMLCSRIDEKYQKKSECSVVSRDTIVFHSTKLELLSLLSAFKDCINRVKILQE